MGLIKNAINFGNGFNIGAVAPIDSRMRVELLSDLTTVWTAEIPAYKGMIVTVMETSDVYVLKDVDNYTNIASWVKLGSADAATTDTANALKEAKKYTDTEVGKLANGSVKTNTEAIAILKGDAETEGSIAKAVATEEARAKVAEKANADAIAAETTARNATDDAIKAKIGEVPADKTVVKMIEDAQAAATKMKLATDELFLTLESTTDEAGAITYTLGTKDLASDAELQDEIERAVATEASLQSQIGKAATEQDGPTGLHKEIADVKTYADEKVSGLDATVGSQTVAEGKHVAVEVVEVDGKLTDVTVVEKDIASADALTAEQNRAISAETANANAITAETKARQDDVKAINDTIGTVAEGKTVVKMIEDAQAAAEDAATLLTLKAEGHVTVSGVQDNTTGARTYTIAENDIASAAVLTKVKEDVDNFFKDATFSEAAKDTLKELQEYITSDAAGALKMEQAIADNKKAIEQEVDDREDAITTLTQTVADNKAAIESTVATLSQTVADNKAAIESTVATLSQTVADNKAAIESTVATLSQTVADNKTAIESTVATLSQTVADNKAALDAKDGQLTQAIEAEAATARAAEQANAADIAAEAERADAAEKANAAAIVTEKERAEDAEKKLGEDLAAEVAKAREEEGKLADAIAAEAERADAAEKANAAAIVTEKERAEDAEEALASRLDVLEGVTVTGKDAIVVSESDAKNNKEVLLKLGTQPAEGKAGIVLSQDANGLVAKLQWGTF